MSDISSGLHGGQQPTNRIAASTFNPKVGATDEHPNGFPVGTPVIASTSADETVIPGKANVLETSFVLGLAGEPAVAGSRVFVQTEGPITLTADQWDAITGDVGGLVKGVPYYLSTGFDEGKLTQTRTAISGRFIVKVGVATSATDLVIRPADPIEVP